MPEYKVKYKISSFVIVFLIIVFCVGTFVASLYYLKTNISTLQPSSPIKTTEAEMTELMQVKNAILDNPQYKQLVPIVEATMVLPEPTVKANPFQTIEQKESQE